MRSRHLVYRCPHSIPLLICAVWLLCAGQVRGSDIGHVVLRDFRLGQSLAEVEAVIGSSTGLTTERWVPAKQKIATSSRLPTVYLLFNDKDFLEIGFVKEGGFRVAEIMQFMARASKQDLLSRFEGLGRHSEKRTTNGSLVYVWGGRAEGQDGVSPLPGQPVSLRVEVRPDETATIRLTGHRMIESSRNN